MVLRGYSKLCAPRLLLAVARDHTELEQNWALKTAPVLRSLCWTMLCGLPTGRALRGSLENPGYGGQS